MGETTTILPWQQVAGQGYGKYGQMNGREIIGPGSSEALVRAINGLASSDEEVKLLQAPRDMDIPNLWDGGYNHPRKGSTVMIYGPLKKPNGMNDVSADWQEYAAKHGRRYLIDKNYSRFPEVMETTYVDPKTGEYLVGQLTDGSHTSRPVIGKKHAHTGFAFFRAGQPVLSSEALADGKKVVESRPFFAVALDKVGCYLTPVNTVLKSKPTDATGEVVYKKLRKAKTVADKAHEYLKAGKCTQEVADNAIRRAWNVFMTFYETAMKIR